MFEVAILGSCNKPIPFKPLLRYQLWAMGTLSHGRHRSFCRPPRRSKRHCHARRRGAKWQSGTVSTPEPWGSDIQRFQKDLDVPWCSYSCLMPCCEVLTYACMGLPEDVKRMMVINQFLSTTSPIKSSNPSCSAVMMVSSTTRDWWLPWFPSTYPQ